MRATTTPLTKGSGGPGLHNISTVIMQHTKGAGRPNPYAISTARPMPIASRSTALSAGCIARSVEIRQVAHQPDEGIAEPVHQAVVSRVDQHVGLSADAHAAQSLVFGRVELDGHRKALRLPQ